MKNERTLVLIIGVILVGIVALALARALSMIESVNGALS